MLMLPGDDAESEGQLEHSAPPGVSLKVPTGHASQAPPSSPVYPALHEHDWMSTLAIGESDPAGHFEQAALPMISLKVPCGQALHGPPKAPVYPSLHCPFSPGSLTPATQSATRALATREIALLGQSEHSELPLASLNFPEEHATQSAPEKPALQRHADEPLLAIGEYELSGHLLQAELPAEFLKDP